MPKQIIFYSWQKDLPNPTNRGFIEDCLERAIKELKSDETLFVEPCLDRDTKGAPGSPDIADTIFKKIDSSAVFVGDVSLINGDPVDGSLKVEHPFRLTPNPNVLAEWGRATKSIGFSRIICVFNTATGDVEQLPFDLRKRKILTFQLRKGEAKEGERQLLVKKLREELRSILDLPRSALDIQFASADGRNPIGTRMEFQNVQIEPIPSDQIPDFTHEGMRRCRRPSGNEPLWR